MLLIMFFFQLLFKAININIKVIINKKYKYKNMDDIIYNVNNNNNIFNINELYINNINVNNFIYFIYIS